MNLSMLQYSFYGVAYPEQWCTFEELPPEYQTQPWEPTVIAITGNTFTVGGDETYTKTSGGYSGGETSAGTGPVMSLGRFR
jgi:hypothetical protein